MHANTVPVRPLPPTQPISTSSPRRARMNASSIFRAADSSHVGFLDKLPVRAVLDGELVAFDEHGKPDFPSLCECVLQRHSSIPLTYMVFDVISVDGDSVAARPYRERRQILEELELNAPGWWTPETFDDGETLWETVCEHELEGVVAKQRNSRYRSAYRGWVKVKNREYWRYELERESAINSRRERVFV